MAAAHGPAHSHAHLHTCWPVAKPPSCSVVRHHPRVPIFHQLPEPDLSWNWVIPSSQREGPHFLT